MTTRPIITRRLPFAGCFTAMAILAGTIAVPPMAFAQAESAFEAKTQHATLRVDGKGFITSLTANDTKKEYSPAKHPSPLLSLHEYGKPDETILAPVAAAYDAAKKEIKLKYPNGSVADIAGVFNRDKNVLGLMPHPENLIESAHGGIDGRALFSNLLQVA